MPRTFRKIGFFTLLLLVALAPAAFAPSNGQSGGATQANKGTEGKYAKYIFYDLKPSQMSPEMAAKMKEARAKAQSTVETTHLVDLDTTRSEGAFYLDFVWLWKGSAKGYSEVEHVHDFDEFLGFIGTKGQKNPHDLGGEIEVWLGGEKYLITKSCLIYVPKGLKHCPIRFNRVDTPILFFSGGMTTKYSRTETEFQEARAADRNYEKYISYDVNPNKVSPEAIKRGREEAKKIGSTVESTRLLDLDKQQGAPYTDFVWLWKGSAKGISEREHTHDFGEVIGFFGSKGQSDPHDLGGEMEVWLGGEKQLITKSCLIYVPPGMKHCPIRFNRIDSPILFFTVGLTSIYSNSLGETQ